MQTKYMVMFSNTPTNGMECVEFYEDEQSALESYNDLVASLSSKAKFFGVCVGRFEMIEQQGQKYR